MNSRIVAPLALLATLTALTACTGKDTPPAPVTTPTQNTSTDQPAVTPAPLPPAPVDSSTGEATPVATPTPAITPVATPTPAPAPTTATPVTKTETVSYTNPSGKDSIEFTLTANDGVITSVAATPKAENDISKKLQTAFASEISTQVVGKKISDLKLSAVGGASLTTGAFNKFVASF